MELKTILSIAAALFMLGSGIWLWLRNRPEQ